MNCRVSFKKNIHKFFHLLNIPLAMSRMNHCLRIVMYHGIGMEGIPPRVFESHLRYFQRHFKIINLDTASELIANPSLATGRELVLTFDDGLMNNFKIAWPCLEYYRIPATFYVCPDLIDTDKWLWNHDVRCRLKSLDYDDFVAINKMFGVEFREYNGFVEWMKTLDLSTRINIENMIRDETSSFTPTEAQHKAFDIMTWEQIIMLDPALITIGSHTGSHPILNSLDFDGLIEEIKGSRLSLESKLDRQVVDFCFPNGDFSDDALRLVRENYKTAVTVVQECVPFGSNPHSLPRVPAAGDLDSMKWRLWRPSS